MVPLFFLLIGSACSEAGADDDTDAMCPAGDLGCHCIDGTTCDVGLTCIASACGLPALGTGGDSTAGTGGTASGGLSGSGGASTGGDSSSGGNASGGATSDGFTLTSSELTEGGMFLEKHTCQGSGFDNDESPPLAWSGAPDGTMSYAITFIDRTLVDQDSPLGYHWAIWNISASVSALPANLPSGTSLTSPLSATQSRASYLGPCPFYGETMPGSPAHSYEFTIYALPTETADITGMIDETMILTLESQKLDSASLTGTSTAYSLN